MAPCPNVIVFICYRDIPFLLYLPQCVWGGGPARSPCSVTVVFISLWICAFINSSLLTPNQIWVFDCHFDYLSLPLTFSNHRHTHSGPAAGPASPVSECLALHEQNPADVPLLSASPAWPAPWHQSQSTTGHPLLSIWLALPACQC